MGFFSVVQTIWSAHLPELSQTARIDITAGASPQLLVHDPVSGQRASLALTDGLLNPAQAGRANLSRDQQDFTFNGQTRSLDGATVDRLSGDHSSCTAYLDGVGFAGNLVSLHRVTLQGQDYLHVAAQGQSGVSTYRIAPSGALSHVGTQSDSASRYLKGVVALDSITVDGTSYLVAASQRENGLTVFTQNTNGTLRQVAAFGFAEQLPVDQPTAMETVMIGDRAFVLLTSFSSSSLTVLELDAQGELRFVDQVNDTQDTRFYRVSALDTITLNDQVLVAVAGADGGVSLFQMLPGGRLIHRDTLIDEVGTALGAVSQLRFVPMGDRVELFVLSPGDKGLTRLALDLGPAGTVTQGPTGTSQNDVLSALPGGSQVNGWAGDDILIDGSGSDVLTGGSGADVFIFAPDGNPDTIADFDHVRDKIDLSAFSGYYRIEDFQVTPLENGLVLRWQDETLTIYSARGGSLSPTVLTHSSLFNSDHVIIPDPLPTLGSGANDVFDWANGPSTVDGGAGFDTLDYSMAPTAASVDLMDNARNAGAATDDVLHSIEGLTGTGGNDTFRGTNQANTLTGADGHDLLEGRGGNDWLLPGRGNDTLDGGSGTDMVSFSDYGAFVRVNLAAGTATSGSETDILCQIEDVTGSIYGDVLQGDAGNNRLRGLGDYDWFIGTDGNDSYDGGSGRDMMSYVYAPGAVTVNLGTGRGTSGQAAGDTYTSIERVTGSIHGDLFYGSDGEEDFRGVGGYDWFIGSGGGKDRYDGGSGSDTVAYWQSSSGVSASLLLGRGSHGDAARDLYTSIENLGGSNHDDHLTGDHGRNYLRGYYGRDTLLGGGGVDRLEGGASDDTLDGGYGWDYALFSGQRNEYAISTRGDVTTVTHLSGSDGTDTLINIEALQFSDDLFYL
ncbi:calcium-binding protein [Falsiruegeria mediterranea]|uniref:Bifunctional hemolysin/adenylate cyclase n=1 Tax=Falsiruegeria mediterranea M17 TaxID=1200281 RepID=A0A2R8CFV2_9RHOB|nr:calcium-binding protein [Falsiruegeria mediterranea]SPJ31305.1 Bifunctional hemolysin/adenylate cyclase [Falsiruegeria mediterranea M17]